MAAAISLIEYDGTPQCWASRQLIGPYQDPSERDAEVVRLRQLLSREGVCGLYDFMPVEADMDDALRRAKPRRVANATTVAEVFGAFKDRQLQDA